MEYRVIDSVKSSLLGFGCMRFPCNEDGTINEEEATKMLDLAREAGVTYFDTAYPYHNKESEPFVGRYLSKLPRDSYYVATKLPVWEIHSLDEAKDMFELQLQRLNTGYIDFYLMHAMNKERWEQMEAIGVYDYLLSLKEEGKIRHLGFSFHDEYEVFELILTSKKWDFCQIQLNYMDTDEQAGMKGYELTEKLGVPLVIMEPIKGGSLANLPDSITQHFTKVHPENSTASWALRWVASLPNVKVVLSGMSTMDQVQDNLKTFGDFQALNDQEQEAVSQVTTSLRQRINNGCTSCEYCLPCPVGVNIPHNFRIWNNYGVYENKGETVWRWKTQMKDEERALNCISCGQCEQVCPQKIEIRRDLANLQKQLDSLV